MAETNSGQNCTVLWFKGCKLSCIAFTVLSCNIHHCLLEQKTKQKRKKVVILVLSATKI